MTTPVIQTAFHSGEWAPALTARVDMAKYKAGCALALNYFVDYRGGLSSRPGTRYIIQCLNSSAAVRLLKFQASQAVGYVLEFGDQYIRFINNGSPVLETALTIGGISKTNPCVVAAVNTYAPGDVVYITGVVGMTQVNGRYFKLTATTAGVMDLADLNGVPVDATGYSTWTSGGTVARVYKIASPYAAADLASLKIAQVVDKLIICHPDYSAYVLTIISATSWTLVPIVFGATVSAPTNIAATTTLSASAWNYSYTVTAVDVNGQESAAGTPAVLASIQSFRSGVVGSNVITWTAVASALSYNIYRAEIRNGTAVPSGAAFGYMGNATGTTFIDSGAFEPDFSVTPPVVQSPFSGAGLASITVGTAGTYTSVPTVTVGAAPGGSSATATAYATLSVVSFVISGAGINYTVGEIVSFGNGVTLVVAAVGVNNSVTAFQPLTYPGSSAGGISTGSTPTNPIADVNRASILGPVQVNLTWGVGAVTILYPGAGYTSAPAITFSSGAAAATSALQDSAGANPSVPALYSQRLVLAGKSNSPASIDMSQPGALYNFNLNNPLQPDSAISTTLISGQLNEIQFALPIQSGLLIFSNNMAWLVNGNASGAPATAIEIAANPQSYIGSSPTVPPIVVNFDILFVQAKGSVVRDITYDFYKNIFTGTDITVFSSHLFFGYKIEEWDFAEEPFKLMQVVRDDGALLTLTFMKEQELIGWTHSTTDGTFKSVATVAETVDDIVVDATYFVVERSVNGNTVKYIERLADRYLEGAAANAWCVDAGLQYDGTPATSFTGGEHLAGETCVGLADGEVITPFVMAVNGAFTLPSAASVVTVGLGYNCDFQTLRLDTGDPTIQAKDKKVPAVAVRVQDALNTYIGTDFTNLVQIKDLVVGNVGGMTNEVVTDLVTGDVKAILDPKWNTTGQFAMRQSDPLPITILGVIPDLVVGDNK